MRARVCASVHVCACVCACVFVRVDFHKPRRRHQSRVRMRSGHTCARESHSTEWGRTRPLLHARARAHTHTHTHQEVKTRGGGARVEPELSTIMLQPTGRTDLITGVCNIYRIRGVSGEKWRRTPSSYARCFAWIFPARRSHPSSRLAAAYWYAADAREL